MICIQCHYSNISGIVYNKPSEESKDFLNFLCLGDWGMNGINQSLVAKEMGEYSEKFNSSFIVALGDNFYFDGVDSDTDPQWNMTFDSVYTHKSLFVPWYVVLGNHDYHKNPQAQIDYYMNKRDRRWQMPNYYYEKVFPLSNTSQNLNHESVHIIFINTPILAPNESSATTKYDHLISEQLQSIELMLQNSNSTWRIVAGHYPIFSEGEHGDTADLITLLLPLLEKYNVDVYLNGHDHTLQHISWKGIQFITSGRGSNPPDGWFPSDQHSAAKTGLRFASLEPGFAAISATLSTLSIEFIDRFGASLYKTILTKNRTADVHVSNAGADVMLESFWILSTLVVALVASFIAILFIRHFNVLSIQEEPPLKLGRNMEVNSLMFMSINTEE